MESIVTVQGKTWIVPANKVSGLIAWLQGNAIDSSAPVQPMQESIQQGKELLVESK